LSIEEKFDIAFVAELALREKQIQQNYRPIIAVHKWFARRPGTLFRSLMLAEFGDGGLKEIYYRGNSFPGVTIADPFMGGGTPLLEANRLGCDVLGFDINPMAAWIVREEIEHLDLDAYRDRAAVLRTALTSEVGEFYTTDCSLYGDKAVPVKYFLWVKCRLCEHCGAKVDLFPGYLLADDSRHPQHVLVCGACGELNETSKPESPGTCSACNEPLCVAGPAKRGRCACRECGHMNRYPDPAAGKPQHRLFALEYYNPKRKEKHRGRFFKKADSKDIAKVEEASARWKRTRARFVPDVLIPPGDETNRLHRWGYSFYRELFNDRQLLGLEQSCRLIAGQKDERVRHALATNLSDLLR
jgi:putative DNA methylase